MIDRILQITRLQSDNERRLKLRRDLMKHEARIGGELFGAVPKGGRREFFCLDEYTWVWYEEWTDSKKNVQSRTTRYDVRPNGITKIQDGGKYQPLSDSEAMRFYDAVVAYERRATNEIYQAVA